MKQETVVVKRSDFIQQVEQRLRDIFSRQFAGKDVSPGMRLRTEGFMEAGIALGMASAEDLSDLVSRLYQLIYLEAPQQDVLDRSGKRVLIPLQMQLAPVKPSTPADNDSSVR